MVSHHLDQQQTRKIDMLHYRNMFTVQINSGTMKDNR